MYTSTADHLSVTDAILADAKLAGYHQRLYCLGPNVGRVSFSSQQVRVLNLVWALKNTGALKPNDKVGVVGAGISGVTDAFALRGYKCSVSVFEKGAAPMNRQSATTHRNIHPHVNWWPANCDLLPTTSLPFLNWHLGPCNEIISLFRSEWRRLRKEGKSSLSFEPNTEIYEISSQPFNENRLVLKATGREFGGFDLVIITSGFGDERDLDLFATPSYWLPDSLEAIKEQRVKHGYKRFIVSGFGDGGQIDALRLAYEFDFGCLPFRVGEAISLSCLEREIKEIEDAINEPNWAIASLRYEALAKKVFECSSEDKQIDKIKSILDEGLTSDTGLVLMVNNRQDHPYQTKTAPIHKFMIAYAKYKGTVNFCKGSVKQVNDQIEVGELVFKLKETFLVIRHGADSFDGGLINKDAWDSMLTARERSREFNFKPAWRGAPLAVPEGWFCPVTETGKFVNSIRALAQRTVSNLGSLGHVKARPDKLIIVDHDIAYKPKYLFGVEVDYESTAEMEKADALI